MKGREGKGKERKRAQVEKTPPLIVAIERTRNGNQDEMRGRFSRVAIGSD